MQRGHAGARLEGTTLGPRRFAAPMTGYNSLGPSEGPTVRVKGSARSILLSVTA
jgi:hypothetical protein